MRIPWLENQIVMIYISIRDRIFPENVGKACRFGYRYPVHPSCGYFLYVKLSQGGVSGVRLTETKNKFASIGMLVKDKS